MAQRRGIFLVREDRAPVAGNFGREGEQLDFHRGFEKGAVRLENGEMRAIANL
jgi:hypothetical protein